MINSPPDPLGWEEKNPKMADENILTWNVSNWITVVLMAAVAFGILAFAQKYIAAKKASA